MISPDPIDDLVAALVDGTRTGAIHWHPADSRGRAYIAKRNSGTVTLQEGNGRTGNVLRLIVKDRAGNHVGEVTRPGIATTSALLDAEAAGMPLPSINAQMRLSELYESVRAQAANADSTLRSLASEFRAG